MSFWQTMTFCYWSRPSRYISRKDGWLEQWSHVQTKTKPSIFFTAPHETLWLNSGLVLESTVGRVYTLLHFSRMKRKTDPAEYLQTTRKQNNTAVHLLVMPEDRTQKYVSIFEWLWGIGGWRTPVRPLLFMEKLNLQGPSKRHYLCLPVLCLSVFEFQKL